MEVFRTVFWKYLVHFVLFCFVFVFLFSHFFSNCCFVLLLLTQLDFGEYSSKQEQKNRSTRPEVFLNISQSSQENTCARISFLIKKRPEACNLKKILWHRCFPVNFAKFLRAPFFTEQLWWLLLKKTTTNRQKTNHILFNCFVSSANITLFALDFLQLLHNTDLLSKSLKVSTLRQ